MTERLDAYQQRHRWASFPIAVLYKFLDDRGNYLAALITYYGFLSLFPLLLLSASILGFVLGGNQELQDRILDSALAQLPLIGSDLDRPGGLRGSTPAVIVGGLLALYGALGVAQALQHAMNTLWSVPRNRRPNPLTARVRSLALLGTGGVAVLATTVLSFIGSSFAAFGAELDRGIAVLGVLAALALNVVVFGFAFRLSTARSFNMADVLPGAVLAALLWLLLQHFGAVYATRIADDTSLYGAFALVLGLLAWLYLVAISVVLAVEVNVVRAKHLYPRSLLTPFSDDVELTAADERVYTDSATAEQAKTFETVHVTFEPSGDAGPGAVEPTVAVTPPGGSRPPGTPGAAARDGTATSPPAPTT
jgi:YihY family inner membrane protein